MPVDKIQAELEQIIENEEMESGVVPLKEGCLCTSCCASRALALRRKEIRSTTTIIPRKRVHEKGREKG